MGNRKDLVDPPIQGIANTSHTAFTFLDFRLINNSFLAFQLKFDFEELRLVHFFRVDLIIEVVEGESDSLADSVGDNGVDVFSVFFPLGLLFVEPDSIVNLFEKFVNGDSAIFNPC